VVGGAVVDLVLEGQSVRVRHGKPGFFLRVYPGLNHQPRRLNSRSMSLSKRFPIPPYGFGLVFGPYIF
jgi:hypothetical protein